MKTKFSNHFANDEQRRAKLWDECVFVFDTNVYTGVYKRSDDARDAFYKVVRSLGDRLWAPYQVVYEYLDNRAKITHDQSKLYAEAIADLRNILSGFESQTKHPFLSVELHKEFVGVAEKAIEELEGKRVFHEARINVDDVKDEISLLLDGKVGDKYSVAQLKDIIKEGEVRYANLDAPGFQDVGKFKGSLIFDQVCKRYGDLIIWKQVIDHAKAVGKPVILITEEQKEDWWEKAGGRTIGPLPELIEEFNIETGQDFYLYSYHNFLEYANSYLDQDTSIEVIEEVRESSSNVADRHDFMDLSDDEILLVKRKDALMASFGEDGVSEWGIAHGEHRLDLKKLYDLRDLVISELGYLQSRHRQDSEKIRKLTSQRGGGDLNEIVKCRMRIKENMLRVEALKHRRGQLDFDILTLSSEG